MKETLQYITDADKRMVAEVKSISEKGGHAEVKKDKVGNWVVYEVNKKKIVIG